MKDAFIFSNQIDTNCSILEQFIIDKAKVGSSAAAPLLFTIGANFKLDYLGNYQ